MAAIVTPLGCPRRARTASCLVRLALEGVSPPFAGFFTRPLVRANLILVRVLLCNVSDPFGCDGMQRRHHRSPTVAASPAGRDPARAKQPVNGSDTDAPFATEVQSFLPLRCGDARRLVSGLSPPSPTMQSYINRDFPVECE